ncbi:MAG: DUF411 domain-containing protein [Candidatus Kariarchaeaceae archaeon]
MPTVRGKKGKTDKTPEFSNSESYSTDSSYKQLRNKSLASEVKSGSKIIPLFIGGILIISLFAITGVFSPDSLDFNMDEQDDHLKLNDEDFNFQYQNLQGTLISSPTCGCCHEYVNYLEQNEISIDFIRTENNRDIKIQNKIPTMYQSCHTMLLEGYFIEGHIPLIGISKLLDERPSFDGITLPGMPDGSPGMPGEKVETFKISSITDGSINGVFATI